MVFGNPYLGISLAAGEQELSKAMRGYWSRMASSGDPTGDGAGQQGEACGSASH